MTHSPEVQQLQRALDDFAASVPAVPGRVNHILHVARRRRSRRRAGGIAVGCGLLLTPLAFLGNSGGSASVMMPPSAPAPPNHVRVVAPGEKVTVAPGVKLWLTAGGKMCWQLDGVSPDCWGAAGGKQGRIGTTGGGPSDSSHHATMYGSYTGRATPAGVRSTVGETNQGTVLTLAGHPGWGAWYTKVRATKMTPAYNRHKSHGAITVYGTSGQTIATFETGLIYGKPFPGKTSWPTATQR